MAGRSHISFSETGFLRDDDEVAESQMLVPDSSVSSTGDPATSRLLLPDSQSSKTDKSHDSGIQMKKQLGLFDGIGIIVGIIVGSGIFISPTGVVMYAGSVGASLFIWAVTGILSTIGALCYAELGTMIPKSGGDYAYIVDIYGPLPAFLYLWVALLIVMPTGNTVIALTFASNILQPFFEFCDHPPDAAMRLVAAVIICFLTYLNSVSVKAATKVQDIFTVTKILALTVIIGTGFYHLGKGHTENYQEPFKDTNLGIGSLATAFYQGFFSFSGWYCLNFIVEELRDPYKNLPRAILISLPLVTVIYFLTNVAYFAVLTPSEVLSSNAVAVTFANRMLGAAAWIIPLFVACSTFGSLNGGIFTCSRLFFVGAREGHLPQALAQINVDALTPVPSIYFLGAVSLLMLVSLNIQVLVNYATFTESAFILVSISALLKERYSNPDRPRPIKVWIGFPITFFVFCLLIVVLPVIERPVEIGIALAVILSGIPVYYIFIGRKNKSIALKKFSGSVTSVIQLLTNSLPQERDE